MTQYLLAYPLTTLPIIVLVYNSRSVPDTVGGFLPTG